MAVSYTHLGEQLLPFPGHLLHIHEGVEFRPLHPFLLRELQPKGPGLQVFHQLGRQLVGNELPDLFLLVVPFLRLQGGLENCKGGNCPTQTLVDAYEMQATGLRPDETADYDFRWAERYICVSSVWLLP